MMELPEEMMINIIVRLPLQSIVKFKLVCREWKSLTESAFFNDLYQSISNSTSSNWPILHGSYRCTTSYLEEVQLNLPRESWHGNSHNWSFTSGVIRKYTQNNNKIKEIWVVACADGLVLLCLLDEDMTKRYYIGNPMLQQWIQLSPPPYLTQYHFFIYSGLVTRMHNGALLGYKIYSSKTGEWRVQHVSCPGQGVSQQTSTPVSLNGKLHWFHESRRRIIVHDFFSHDEQVREICIPARMLGSRWHPDDHGSCIRHGCASPCNKIICTTSQGYFVLIEAGLIDEVKSYNVKVWRLKSDSWNWEKALEINMACVGLGFNSVPMAINYFDINIIYQWDLDRQFFIACNLRTHTKSHGNGKHGAPYKEDTMFLESRSCISQFVPSLQVVPT
ncbi:F-box domain [Arabidopsis suecica]|uniref:F-box domain n=1 Tax=Arabidopsis suecica TaxID=45249 RepID=A0A8T1ZDG9_ARASU|nr:F-box domain [Arabidopsis suecica]